MNDKLQVLAGVPLLASLGEELMKGLAERAEFLAVKKGDLIVRENDPGDALFASIDLPVQGARAFLAPAFYASLGYAVPAAIGAQCTCPDSRPLVLVGDGAFQMTGVELSTCAKYGLDPLVIVLNNGGYTTERLILDGAFNDIQPWDYSKLPALLGAGRSCVVKTVGDLEAALDTASVRDGQFFLIDVRLDKKDVSPALIRLGERLKQAATAGMHNTNAPSAGPLATDEGAA